MIDRQKVYNKYGGVCGYCGHPITFDEMQVDHIHPKCNGGTDEIENLNPSCRLCNHYKRSESVSTFKNWLLGGIIERLKKVYIFRVALRYGMIEIKEWDKKFYFDNHKES